MPLLVGLAVLAASLVLWRALVLREEEQIVRNAALEARNLGNALEGALHGRVLTLGRFAARWSDDGGRTEQQFRRESGRILRDLGGFEAVVYVDSALFNRWVEPESIREQVEGRPLPLEPRRAEALERARGNPAPVVSRPVELMHGGGTGLLTLMPVTRNGAFDGYLLGVFQLDRFVGGVLDHQGSTGYSVALYEEGTLLWESVMPGTRPGERTRAVTVDFEGTRLTLAVTPGPAVVDAERSPLPEVVLAAGAAVAILVALALRMAFVARFRAAEANAARGRLEKEGREREAFAALLQRSNRELQDFAYVASHDLQEPLRKIQAFGDRLKMRYGPALDEQGRDYLERMQGAAGRMRELLEGLLDFSRITTNARPFQKVDLGAVARQVLTDLEVRIDESGAMVEVGELPTIDADPLQMRQLLQNLVGNALKFHEPGKQPVVRISAVVRDGRCELSVSDEGIGFDEQHLDKIFAVFQRLHGRAWEGSGVGLAICRKIAGRHGGDIGARSTPGQGATFVVHLPVEQAQEQANPAA